MVERHAGQRQGADDDQPAGGRQPADEGQQRQGFALCGEAEAEVKYSGLVLTPSLRPAQRISGTAKLISSRYSGNPSWR